MTPQMKLGCCRLTETVADFSQYKCLLLGRRHRKTFEIGIHIKPDITKRALRIFVKMQEGFGSSIEDAALPFDQLAMRAQPVEHRFQLVGCRCAGVFHGPSASGRVTSASHAAV